MSRKKDNGKWRMQAGELYIRTRHAKPGDGDIIMTLVYCTESDELRQLYRSLLELRGATTRIVSSEKAKETREFEDWVYFRPEQQDMIVFGVANDFNLMPFFKLWHEPQMPIVDWLRTLNELRSISRQAKHLLIGVFDALPR